MKQILFIISLALLFVSCKQEKKIIVSSTFIDSLITNYKAPAELSMVETDLRFWKERINPKSPGYVNELKYAGNLVKRFHLTGNITDVITADSILYIADRAFEHKEPSPNLSLIRNSILQHRFKDADSLLQYARLFDIKKYESALLGFDVAFELGNYVVAEGELKTVINYSDYNYNFRLAKMAHYKGDIDTAIVAMHRASLLAGDNISLKQAALSNEADLNLHSGNLQRANDLYVESIRLSAADLHSLMGLGWLALVHDKNDSLAEKIFKFVQTKTKAPDVLYKLSMVADERGDTLQQKKYATEFEQAVAVPAYGNMYNKYLIELYTGILQQPAKAFALTQRELLNRSTPQVYAWHVWALHNNNKIAEAEKIYQQHVSGKPLEGLELYMMGKYMQAQGKGYNAKQYFKAAFKNRYDLSPSMLRDLEAATKE